MMIDTVIDWFIDAIMIDLLGKILQDSAEGQFIDWFISKLIDWLVVGGPV